MLGDSAGKSGVALRTGGEVSKGFCSVSPPLEILCPCPAVGDGLHQIFYIGQDIWGTGTRTAREPFCFGRVYRHDPLFS
jgi:hypothetical protein